MRFRAVRNSPLGFGWLSKKGIAAKITDGWAGPRAATPAVRRDTAKLLKGASPRYTLEAAKHSASSTGRC